MSASPEFVDLCQAQVSLLTEGLGAALSIVYLTEELTDVADAKLVPVAAYPEAAAEWGEEQVFSLLSQYSSARGNAPRLLSAERTDGSASAMPTLPAYSEALDADCHPLHAAERALLRQQQIVLPLMHEEMVMGLLVTARADRAWSEAEQSQLQQVANTLALACFLDQRAQWLVKDLRQQRLLREQRHDVFDNLLHQFRNPLTALRTFGKLLVKRLNPSDANRTVAEGIVRESDRLQELLQQFNAAIDLDDVAFRRLLNAYAGDDVEPSDSFDAGELRAVEPVHATPLSLPPSAPPLLPGSNALVGSTIQLTLQPVTDVIEPLLDSAEVMAQEQQLDLDIDIPPNLPPVRLDARALREVLNNLIDNALKYTPANGLIYVAVRSRPVVNRSQQAIVIADTGPGIPSQDLEHLFERHYRGVQAATDIPGTGLGLAIARELVHQMQGEIQVFSPAQTSGLVPALDAFSSYPGTAVVVWLSEE